MSVTISSIIEFLEDFAPRQLAENWDNIGLLVGDAAREVTKVMTCLTLTPDVAEEAMTAGAELVVSHHPVLFRPIQRLTADQSEGGMLLELIEHRIAVYSPHTAFDSAASGINQSLAEKLGLTGLRPLRMIDHAELPVGSGSGRYGMLPTPQTLEEFLGRVRSALNVQYLQFSGDLRQQVTQVGVACGSAAEFLGDAHRLGCDVLLTGEGRFHSCLEARAIGTALVLAGHYATERPAVEQLAEVIQQKFPALSVWSSAVETDPVQWSVG